MIVKDFVLSYAHYRRLGFTEAESIDFAMSRPRATVATEANTRSTPVRERRPQLRLVEGSS